MKRTILPVLALFFATAYADPAPQSLIEADRELCARDCLGENGGGEDKLCLQLCACASRTLGTQLDRKGYLALRAEMASGDLSRANRNILDQTRMICLREAGIDPEAEKKSE